MVQFKATMRPITIIQRLAAAKSKRSQQKIITDAWQSDSEEFFLGLEMALDPSQDFHLDSAPEIQDVDDGDPGTLTFSAFYLLAKSLANGDVKGEFAKRAVDEAAMKANISEWNLWYRRILLKTLDKSIPMDVIRSTLIRLTTS